MKKLIGMLVLAGVAGAVGAVVAHDKIKHANPRVTTTTPARSDVKKVSLTGEIVDPQCWFTHNGEGMGHAKCAVLCARGGQDLAFLDARTGELHTLIAPGHGKNPNDGLYEHVGMPVQIRGTLYQRGTNRGLMLDAFEKGK